MTPARLAEIRARHLRDTDLGSDCEEHDDRGELLEEVDRLRAALLDILGRYDEPREIINLGKAALEGE